MTEHAAGRTTLPSMQDFKNLDVWTKSHELVLEVYRCTTTVHERRAPGLTSQLRRASSAIPANIAEGCGHASQREFARFLQIAVASAHELQYHLLLGKDLGVIPIASYARLEARTEQVKRMLGGLTAKVRRDITRSGSSAVRTESRQP